MPLESAQLLCTAHRVLDQDDVPDFLYKVNHINHPCAIWARKNIENYIWLTELTRQLFSEYTYRYGKVHKTEADGILDYLLDNPPNNISYDSFTEPPLAMPDDCKVIDRIQSYRNYYNIHKQHIAFWNGKVNGRSIPEWFNLKENVS